MTHVLIKDTLVDNEDKYLFNPRLIDQSKNPLSNEGIIFRPLRSDDYEKGFIPLLGELTEVGNITQEQFLSRFWRMKTAGGYYVVVIEDQNLEKVIGSATLVVEQKFIHNCALRGHLEDVVVNSAYRGKNLGKLLVSEIMRLAKHLHCYKLTLECKDKLIPFYQGVGFTLELGNSNSMNVRFQHDNPAEHSRL